MSDEPADTAPLKGLSARDRWSLAAVLAATLGVGLIFGFQPPLVSLILAREGTSGLEIGTINGISTVAVILLGPFYPSLIGGLGLRRSIATGTALAVVVLLLMPVFTGALAWLVLRFLTGCALGLAWIASEIWLNRLATDRSRGTVMGFYATVFAAGVAAGPVLLQITGTTGSVPFWVGAAGLVLTAIPLFWVGDPSAHDEDGALVRPMAALVRAAPVVMLAALVAGLVESADISLLPVFGLDNGLDEEHSLQLVTVFLVGNVILQLPIGRLADHLGRKRVLGACAIVSAIGPLLLPASVHDSGLMWPLLFVWGGTMYGFYTQGIALLGESFPVGELAAANTVFVMVYSAGGVVGPGLGGFAMDLWRPSGLVFYVSGAAFLLVAGLLSETMRRSSRSH